MERGLDASPPPRPQRLSLSSASPRHHSEDEDDTSEHESAFSLQSSPRCSGSLTTLTCTVDLMLLTITYTIKWCSTRLYLQSLNCKNDSQYKSRWNFVACDGLMIYLFFSFYIVIKTLFSHLSIRCRSFYCIFITFRCRHNFMMVSLVLFNQNYCYCNVYLSMLRECTCKLYYVACIIFINVFRYFIKIVAVHILLKLHYSTHRRDYSVTWSHSIKMILSEYNVFYLLPVEFHKNICLNIWKPQRSSEHAVMRGSHVGGL